MGNMIEYVKMALKNIKANKGRSFLTMLGIIIGISSVIMVMAVGDGTANAMNSELEDLGTGQINVYCSDDAINATGLLATRGEGITGIALRVDDIEEAERHFAELGLTPDVRINHGGMKEILFKAQEATHNVEIAINEYPEANGLGLEVAHDLGVDA